MTGKKKGNREGENLNRKTGDRKREKEYVLIGKVKGKREGENLNGKTGDKKREKEYVLTGKKMGKREGVKGSINRRGEQGWEKGRKAWRREQTEKLSG